MSIVNINLAVQKSKRRRRGRGWDKSAGSAVCDGFCRRRALCLPVLIHGMYDFLASLDFDYSGLIFIVFIIVVFLAASRRVKIVSRNDRFIR
mgnify:CR=1 FL=1